MPYDAERDGYGGFDRRIPIGGTVPTSILARLDAYCKAKARKRSQVIADALFDFLERATEERAAETAQAKPPRKK